MRFKSLPNDEMGPLATTPRGDQGWGKGPVRGSDRYQRFKTIQLLAASERTHMPGAEREAFVVEKRSYIRLRVL